MIQLFSAYRSQITDGLRPRKIDGAVGEHQRLNPVVASSQDHDAISCGDALSSPTLQVLAEIPENELGKPLSKYIIVFPRFMKISDRLLHDTFFGLNGIILDKKDIDHPTAYARLNTPNGSVLFDVKNLQSKHIVQISTYNAARLAGDKYVFGRLDKSDLWLTRSTVEGVLQDFEDICKNSKRRYPESSEELIVDKYEFSCSTSVA